jgi:hypothetical protein
MDDFWDAKSLNLLNNGYEQAYCSSSDGLRMSGLTR